MKKMFWNKFKVRSAAAVLAAALAFSMSAPLALAAQPEEAAASAGTVQEADMPTLQPETGAPVTALAGGSGARPRLQGCGETRWYHGSYTLSSLSGTAGRAGAFFAVSAKRKEESFS